MTKTKTTMMLTIKPNCFATQFKKIEPGVYEFLTHDGIRGVVEREASYLWHARSGATNEAWSPKREWAAADAACLVRDRGRGGRPTVPHSDDYRF